MNRRSFLKTVSALGAGYALNGAGWAAQKAPILNLELVTREYARMYDYLKKEKEVAELEKKDLAIVTAELHNSSNSSVLLNMMVISICGMLGIKNLFIEVPNNVLDNTGLREESLKFREITDKEGCGVIDRFSLRLFKKIADPKNPDNANTQFPEKYNPGCRQNHANLKVWATAIAYGMNFEGSDPLHDMPEDAADARTELLISEKREEWMKLRVGTLQEGARLSLNGSVHSSVIMRDLNARKEKHAIGLNFTCGVNEVDKHTKPKVDLATLKTYERRFAAVDAFYTPKIPLNPQVQVPQAFALVLLASCENRARLGEDVGLLKKILDTIIKEAGIRIPGQSTGKAK